MSHTATLVTELTVLVLAIFLGFEVISKVPTLLHPPLMSGTNAIHGIVIVGAMLVVGLKDLSSTMPYHASMLYSRNVQALLLHLAPEGELTLDWSDEITSGACVAGKQEVAA